MIGRKRIRYKSLRVEEDTSKLAKQLSAKAGMSMKDFVQVALEISENQNLSSYKERKRLKKQNVFDFKW